MTYSGRRSTDKDKDIAPKEDQRMFKLLYVMEPIKGIARCWSVGGLVICPHGFNWPLEEWGDSKSDALWNLAQKLTLLKIEVMCN